jgi:hypothetical protein
VIGLVLDDARRKLARAQLDAIAMPIVGLDADFARARHAAADVGNAQASLPVVNHVAADDRDFGVDQDDRLPLIAVLGGIEGGDEDAYALVHLRRREADAVVLGHRVDHVVDQLLSRGALDFRLVERPGLGTQHGMPHARDLQNSHG